MKLRSILLSFTFCIIGFNAFAQTGCIIVFGVNSADSKVYTVSLGSNTTCNSQTVEKFNTSTFTNLASGCSWSPNPAASPATVRNCIVGSSCGYKATYTQACDLDDHEWALAVMATGIGFFTIAKRKKFLKRKS